MKNVFLWPLTYPCPKKKLSPFVTLYFSLMDCFFSSYSPCTNTIKSSPLVPPPSKVFCFSKDFRTRCSENNPVSLPLMTSQQACSGLLCNHSSTIPSTIALNYNLVDLLLGVIYYILSSVDSDRAINEDIKNKLLSSGHLFLLHESLVNMKIYYLSNAP